MSIYEMNEKSLFNVARTFCPDFVPDGMAAKYRIFISGSDGVGNHFFDSREKAVSAFDDFCERNPDAEIDLQELIYTASGDLFHQESIMYYYY